MSRHPNWVKFKSLMTCVVLCKLANNTTG